MFRVALDVIVIFKQGQSANKTFCSHAVVKKAVMRGQLIKTGTETCCGNFEHLQGEVRVQALLSLDGGGVTRERVAVFHGRLDFSNR